MNRINIFSFFLLLSTLLTQTALSNEMSQSDLQLLLSRPKPALKLDGDTVSCNIDCYAADICTAQRACTTAEGQTAYCKRCSCQELYVISTATYFQEVECASAPFEIQNN